MAPPFFRRSKSMITTAAELANETNHPSNGISDSTTGTVIPSAAPSASVVRKSKSFKRIRGLLRVASGSTGNHGSSGNSSTTGSVSESRRGRLRVRKGVNNNSTGSSVGGGSINETATTPTAANLSSITTTTPGSGMTHSNNNNHMTDTSFISTASSGMMLPNHHHHMIMMNDENMDEVSTINYYNVDVDERSVVTQRSTITNNLFGNNNTTNSSGGTTIPSTIDDRLGREVINTNTTTGMQSPPPTTYILKVVLLLMDPETRRFELLQLEFDSYKALVSDVLAQIPISVTEDTLRKQYYIAIANQYGTEMIPSKLLASFCKGNEVLVAIPSNVSTAECIRLARPILSDENVVAMLHSSGIDASGWKEDPNKKKNMKKKSALKGTNDDGTTTSRNIGTNNEMDIALQAEPLDAHMKRSKISIFFTIACMIFIGLLLQVFHIYISAPINVGSTISPGVWLSKCGLYSLIPTYCTENAYVHFHRNGTVSYYNAEKVLLWTMEGAVCPEVEETTTTTTDAKSATTKTTTCIRGMHVQNDGKIIIGGKPIYHVISYSNNNKKEPPLSPWPFVENPKLKIWRK